MIATNQGSLYLHLPGVIMAQNAAGQRVYLLSDGLGSIRQVISSSQVIGWREYEPYGQLRAAEAFTNTFDSGLEGWSTYASTGTGAVSNSSGVMRLSATTSGSGVTVKKLLNGAPGSLTLSTVMTTANWTTLFFWVEYADGSIDYIYSGGTVWGTFNPSYTTPVDKVAVALYIYAAASTLFPPIQVDVDPVRVIPVSASQAVVSPVYGYTGEWWENDLNLLHLRARWYDPETGTFLSRDPKESEPPYLYARGNSTNLVDPSGMTPPPPPLPPGMSLDWETLKKMGPVWEAWWESVMLNNLKSTILDTAKRLNNPQLTNMNNEAFASMIGAKFIMEDAYFMRRPDKRLGSWLASQFPRSFMEENLQPYPPFKGEVSFGIANIPLGLADKILAAWYMEGKNVDFQPYFSLPIAPVLPTLMEELESARGAVEYTGAAILYGAYEARVLNPAQTMINYKCRQVYPRLAEEVSAYIIAAGVIHHGAAISLKEDQYHSVYNPATWSERGSQGVWTDAIPDAARIMGITGLNYLAYMSYETEVLQDEESQKHIDQGGRIGP